MIPLGRLSALIPLLTLVSTLSIHAADLATWPSQYLIRPWETAKLTAADVVGPDGIVYPDFTGVGFTGGIPDVNNSTIRATYTVFNVKNYGALGDGVTPDDDAVAATAARNHLNASGANKAILHFPSGIYVLDTPISFTQSNLVIDGEDPASTIIKLATDTAQSGALFTLAKPAAFSAYLTVTAFAPRGANTLTLSGDPATIQLWLASFNLPTDGTGAGALDAYPDGDGVNNLLEYAFDSDPTTNDGGNLPTTSIETIEGSDYLNIAFERLTDPASGVT
ncbi:MAG: hypothetical protein H7067_01895 [Burkholderiales bacterium]|nr:hypothetical protein [Opitutaceae bacterium]